MKPGIKPTPARHRFATKWEPHPTEMHNGHPCWDWKGGKMPLGYGNFLGPRGKVMGAHRAAYELYVGPIPAGMSLDHLCRRPSCVNPSHLEVVTHRENVLRGEAITAKNAKKTHCLRGHPFDEENTRIRKYANRKGRACKTCDKAAYDAAYKAGKIYVWKKGPRDRRTVEDV